MVFSNKLTVCWSAYYRRIDLYIRNLDPVMVMAGISPARYSHHMIKETGCFVINFPRKSYQKEYNYLGSVSGRDEDKFATTGIKWEDASYVNAPILTDCPVSIECSVVDSITPGTHELFIGKVEAIHVDEEYLDANGNILWEKREYEGLSVNSM